MNTTPSRLQKLIHVIVAIAALAVLISSACVPVAASQPRAEVAEVADRVHAMFGVVLADRTAHWTLDEAQTVFRALDRLAVRIKIAFGQPGEPLVKALMDGAVFYRDGDNPDCIAFTIAGTVSFYNLWAGYDEAKRTFYLYHEMGHLLDTRGSVFHLFMGEISGQFSGRVGAYTDSNGQYQLGAAFPRPTQADQPIRHRTDSASEDWAETFASVLMPEFENDLRNVGDARLYEVRDQFVRFLASRHHDQRADELLAANE